jgi:hypothetical protein
MLGHPGGDRMTKPEYLAPMLPPSCDLRKFPDMPLDVNRLRKSEIRVRSRAEEFRAAVMVWCAAWHEIPAGSVADDDMVLADIAGFGSVVREWKKVRAAALRGFVRCSDGRLYHPVIVAKAITAWRSLLERQHMNECGRLKKEYQRKRTPENERHYPTFDLWIINNCPEAAPFMSLGTGALVPRDSKDVSPEPEPDVPRKIASNRSDQNIEDLSTNRFPGDSSIPAQPSPPTAGGDEPPPNPEALARVLVELRRAQVVDATGGNEIVLRLMREGATATQFGRACAEARQPGSKPFPAELRMGYVEAILKRVMRDDRQARERSESKVAGTQSVIAEQRAAAQSAAPMPESLKPRKRAA